MKYLKKALIPMVILSMLMSGCGKKEEVAVVEEATAVQVQSMELGSIKKELVYAGQVKPKETIQITSKLSGQVDQIYHDLGDYVNAGDVLFTLDKKDIQDQITQLEAQLKVSNASVASAQTSLEQVNGGASQTQIVSLQTNVENAEKNLDNTQIGLDNAKISLDNAKIAMDDSLEALNNAQTNYDNMKSLYNAGVISKTDYDSAELRYTQSKNAYDKAKNAYDQSKNAYDQAVIAQAQSETSYQQAKENYEIYVNKTTKDNLKSAQSGVNTAVASRQSVQTQLQILRTTLNDTAVRSPISGIISDKNISETNMVSAQSAPFTVVDMSSVTVDVNVSEKIINNLNPGQQVDVIVNTISDQKITGTIKNLSPAANNTSTYPVKIEIDNADGKIKPGMFAEIHFVESQNDSTMVVPRNTVVEKGDKKYVYLTEGENAKQVEVETGIDNGEQIEILTGVKAGDNVIVKGQNYVENGSKIKIVTDDASDGESEGDSEATEETTAKEE